MILNKYILNLMYRFLPEIDGVHEFMQQGLHKKCFHFQLNYGLRKCIFSVYRCRSIDNIVYILFILHKLR